MNKKLSIFLITGAIALVCFVSMFFIFPKNQTNPDDLSKSEIPPTSISPTLIVPEEINLYIDQNNVLLGPTILNKPTSYTLTYFCNEDVIKIQDGFIIPQKVGSEIVLTRLSYGDKSIEKTTQVNVYDAYTKAIIDIYLNEEKVDKLFVGNKYKLVVDCNTVIIGEYNLNYSTNVKNITKLNQTDNKIYYEFELQYSNTTTFDFTLADKTSIYTYLTYEYISDIKIFFNSTPYTSGIQKLYLFNTNYYDLANADGYYDSIQFSYSLSERCYDDITVTSVGDCAEIVGDKIVAKQQGNCNLMFSANDGSHFSKQISFCVENIYAEKIVSQDIDAKINEEVDVLFTLSPIYCLDKVTITCNQENITLQNQKFTATKGGLYEIIICGQKTSTKININVEGEISFNFEIPSTALETYDIQIEKNNINIIFVENFYLPIKYYFINDQNEIINESFSCKINIISDKNTPNYTIDNGRILLEITEKQNLSIEFVCNENTKINFTLFINIS